MFEQPIVEGDLRIPAIRGVGGGVIYFVDGASELARVWELGFESLPHDAGDAGLERIDHIAQSMNYEEMLSWVLFYTAIFETRKSPMVDVLDPSGIVRSQVIENPAGALRLTLNGAENSRTIAGRFVTETFGSSVQHIALSSRDIFASAEAFAAAGFPVLAISPNYYDDLAARFDLDEALLHRLSVSTSFTTMTRMATSSSSTARPSARASSSKSSSAAATTAAMAPPTPPSASPPSDAPSLPRGFRPYS